MYVFCPHVYLCTLCVQFPWRPEEGIVRPPNWSYGCLWVLEPSLGPLEEQQALLIAEPYLQPPARTFNVFLKFELIWEYRICWKWRQKGRLYLLTVLYSRTCVWETLGAGWEFRELIPWFCTLGEKTDAVVVKNFPPVPCLCGKDLKLLALWQPTNQLVQTCCD